ncbi:hypothetical protein QVD17_38015 [Tagetes erecta]|uniref:Aminotransferase-like plant mobile domain-containing protein n=1 Tax=Tagetes erecta TaxID=13708 RepID=A0AAD8NKB8_TARER|nr:hypothetical protein QVD17_38015 [Tagetes erecta]
MFHLPFGEMTVTLEDINVLYELPVEGEALTGFESSNGYTERRKLCQDYLGFDTQPSDYKNNMIKMSTMINFMLQNPISSQSTEEECIKRARCVSFILCAKTVLADGNIAHASLHLLDNLKDLKSSGQKSWGGAALACLYRELSKGAKPDVVTMGGPMSLLQIWAWTRILPLAPRILDEKNQLEGTIWWAEHEVSQLETPTHVIKAHRTTSQNLREADVGIRLTVGSGFNVELKRMDGKVDGNVRINTVTAMDKVSEESALAKSGLSFHL